MMLDRTTTPRRIAVLGVLAVAALLPATAAAAPARTGTATLDVPYTWTGGPITGASTGDASCMLPGSCDDTVVSFPAGDATIKISDASAGGVDLDLYVFKSDAAGTVGPSAGSSAGGTADEMVKLTVDTPTTYLVRVVAATANNATFKGSASIVRSTAPPAPTGPSTGPNAPGAPAPPAQKVISSDPEPASPPAGGGTTGGGAGNAGPTATITRPSSSGAVTVLRGKALDRDGTVARVQVALLKVAPRSRCAALKASGGFGTAKACTTAGAWITASGGKDWSLKLKGRLPKGTYFAYARATDNDGKTGTVAHITFRVT